jgi:hypothetical protein
MLPLRCATQNYDWGVPASLDSKVRAAEVSTLHTTL